MHNRTIFHARIPPTPPEHRPLWAGGQTLFVKIPPNPPLKKGGENNSLQSPLFLKGDPPATRLPTPATAFSLCAGISGNGGQGASLAADFAIVALATTAERELQCPHTRQWRAGLGGFCGQGARSGLLLFYKILACGLLAVLLSATMAFATNTGDTPFTLTRAIEVAMENNSLIKEAIENQKAAIEEQKSARADFLPKASAAYSYTRLKDNPYVMLGREQFEVADNDQYHWDVTLKQPIFTGFALSTKYKMAKLGIDMKDTEKNQAVLDVVKEVKVAYFNILLAKKFLLVADEAVSQLESHVRDAGKFYEQGMIAYNDLLKPKVALADAEQNRVRAESNVEMAISAFNTVLQMDLNRKTDVEDILDITPSSYDLTSLIKEAMENRPELKALRLTLENSDYAIRLARSSHYPEVALVGMYEQNGHNPEATENDFGNWHNSSITVQATWTFFEWGKTRAQVNKYRRNKRSLTEKVKGIEDSIKLEVKDAFLNLKVAEKNIHTADESLAQAKENWRITNLQYQQQMTTSTEVLDARTFLTQAETNYYGALYGYMISLAELERAVGRR